MCQAQNTVLKRWTCLAAGAAAAMLAAPGRANAEHDWFLRVGVGGVHRVVELPVYALTADQAYSYRTRRVRVEPEYRERTVRILVPAVVEAREIPVYDRYGRIRRYRRVRVVIEPAHYEYRTEWTLVREGYYETIRERVPVHRLVGHHAHGAAHAYRIVGHGGLGFEFGYRKGHEHKHHRRRIVRRVLRSLIHR